MATTDRFEQKCFYHPDVTTGLRCSRCEKPICPRCMVASPVGYRCPDCARGPRPIQYQTSASGIAKAVALGVAVAVAVGLLWGHFPDWQFYLALLLGFGVVESMAWGAKYRRGRELQTAAYVCIALGLIVSRVAIAGLNDDVTLDMLLNNATDRFVAARFQLRLLPDFLFAAIPFAIAYIRFR